MANNSRTLADENGQYPDWIELQNTGTSAVNLQGWKLSAVSANSKPWSFGSTNLAPGQFLVVFASGKNRTTPGLPFHTDFTLLADGDELILLHPDGQTRASDIVFGQQWKDRSQGIGRVAANTPLIPLGAPARFHVPTAPGDSPGWQGGDVGFDDSGWIPVTTGIGFDRSTNGSTSLLAYWNFNSLNNQGRVPDLSSGAHAGTLTQASLSGPGTGVSLSGTDRALNLTGTSVMVVPDAAKGAFDRAVANNAITISLWIWGGPQQPAPQMLFWAGSNTDGGGIRSLNVHLPWSDSVIYWDTGCCDPSTQRVSVSEPDSTLWKGRWNHYAFVKRGTTKQIWQNGKLLLEGTNTDPLAPIRSFYLGAMTATGSSGYQGLVDEVSIWDSALRPEQIQALSRRASAIDLRELPPFIASDVADSLWNVNASAWLRIPFTIENPAAYSFLSLRLRYNDGFAAYLNGVELLRRNAPTALSFDSSATAERPQGTSTVVEEIELGAPNSLRAGRNILAFHALNRSIDNPSFLLQPELNGGLQTDNRFFVEPTPGKPNGAGFGGFVDEISFSAKHGLYWEPFDLQLRCPTPGSTLIYTLDGSVPSLTNGTRSQGTNLVLQIRTTTTVRAMAFREDFAPSEVKTRSYLFPNDVAAQARPAGIGTTWPSGHPTDFTIDARVVKGARAGYEFTNALTSIPTISIVTPQDGLFGSAQGIYPNSGNHGEPWERVASMEWIDPSGRDGFTETVGLRIHGGISRDKGFTPKHGFSVVFRSALGAGKLDYPIFPDTPVRGFNRLLFRAGSTDTWPCAEWDQFVDGEKRWYRKDSSYIRDQYVRDLQIAMGQASGHGTYAHLYLNGLYWGLYNVCERPDDDFNALRYGGENSDYDVLSDFAEVHQGNAEAWNQLMTLAGGNMVDNAIYFRLLGRNRDGSRNPNQEVLLDAENLADYMILHIWFTADDWPSHNWWAARRRGALSTGFKFFAWDQEISNNSIVKQHNSYGQIVTQVDNFNTPAYLYARCRLNAEFKQLFADRVQKHLFQNGALTPSNAVAQWNRRIEEIDRAVVAESARWGDFQRPSKPFTREVEWMTNLLWMRNIYFPTNTTIALRKIRAAGLFPTVAAPTLEPFGGLVTPNSIATLTHTNATGTLYYTLDGSDPRLVGGTVSPTALVYSNPIPLSGRTRVLARVRTSTWSPLTQAEFFVPQEFSSLQPTEIHYHPSDFNGEDGDDFEFVELANLGSDPLDLSGLEFNSGVQYPFTAGTKLAPGAAFLLVSNPDAFSRRHPGVRIDGVYQGNLANSGETLSLRHSAGFTVFTVPFDDNPPWNTAADGTGSSLQRISTQLPPESPSAWSAGAPSPGTLPDFGNLDSDGDGIPNAWEQVSHTDPKIPDADLDPDGDGFTNRAEYLAGTHATDPASFPRLDIASHTDGIVELRFIASSNRIHSIQRRNAAANSWESWTQFEPNPETRELRLQDTTSEADSKWYRLLILMPVR